MLVCAGKTVARMPHIVFISEESAGHKDIPEAATFLHCQDAKECTNVCEEVERVHMYVVVCRKNCGSNAAYCLHKRRKSGT